MMNLKIVLISGGDGEKFEEDIFNNSTNIEKIAIEQINLKSLPKNIFQHQTKLIELILTLTKLTELLDGTFDKTEDITLLNLSDNRLKSISRYLYLNNNEIKTIDNSFKNLKNLHSIRLQHNQLSHCKMNNLFDNLTKLTVIDFSYNNLTQFNISSEKLFYHLSMLNLSHNNFSSSNFNNWSLPIYHNCEIDFSYNKFTEINVDDFYLQLKLKYLTWKIPNPKIQLNLNENPINCDCNSLKLVQFIKNERTSYDIYRYFEIDSIDF
ncbi:unnamed protein product, partial [Diamesa tonsa]